MTHAAPISGTISLPGSQTASGGMLINISARDVSGNGLPFNFVNVSIAAGASSANFSLDNIPDDAGGEWQIGYSCFSNFIACREFVLRGFYATGSAGNVSYREADVTTVSQGSSSVNFELLEGVTFTGSLSMPSGTAPPEEIDTQIFITTTDFSVSENIRFSIAEDESSVDFSITMPMDGALNYRVRYECDPTTSSSGVCSSLYLRNGFFQSTSAINTVASSDDAQLINGASLPPFIDMTLIPGASISGTISRIDGTGNADPVAFSVRAIDQTGGKPAANDNIEIPAGSDSIPYTLVVDPDAMSTWKIRLACNSVITEDGCRDYGRFSYYDEDTPVTFTTAEEAQADPLAGNTTHIGINMIPVGAKFISGTILLPDGVAAPAEGIELTVSAQEFTGGAGGTNFSSTTVSFEPEGKALKYSVLIADIPGAEWLVSVNCNEFTTPVGCQLLADSPMYYDLDTSPSFVTLNFGEADLVSGVGNIGGVNMILIPAEQVSGTIILGNNRVAPAEGLVVRITARGLKDGVQEGTVFNLVTVPAQQNQTPYLITLPELDVDGWILEFECNMGNPAPNCRGYLPEVYYSANAPNTTTPNEAAATLIELGNPNNNIDITLLAQSDELCVPVKSANGAIALICL